MSETIADIITPWWAELAAHPKRIEDCVTGEGVSNYTCHTPHGLAMLADLCRQRLESCDAFQVRQAPAAFTHPTGLVTWTFRIRWIGGRR